VRVQGGAEGLFDAILEWRFLIDVYRAFVCLNYLLFITLVLSGSKYLDLRGLN
jgi:hypothetical protein